MKKVFINIVMIILIVVFMVSTLLIYIENHFYPRTAMITKLDEVNNVITVTCCNGNVYQYSSEIEDWMVGDFCSMIVYDNNTELVFDDVVVSIKYDGYLELFESIPYTE